MANLIDYRCMGVGPRWVGLGHESKSSPGSGFGWVGFGSMKWTHGQLWVIAITVTDRQTNRQRQRESDREGEREGVVEQWSVTVNIKCGGVNGVCCIRQGAPQTHNSKSCHNQRLTIINRPRRPATQRHGAVLHL